MTIMRSDNNNYNLFTTKFTIIIDPNFLTHLQFKEDIRPEWESPECVGGGEWMVQLASRETEKLDQYWLNAILGCIGAEAFDKSLEDSICGVAVAIRKTQLRISLWLRPCEDKLVSTIHIVVRANIFWDFDQCINFLTLLFCVHLD